LRFPGSTSQPAATVETVVESAPPPVTTAAPVYWENRFHGLWVASNPIPGDIMDTLLQISWRFPRPYRTADDIMLRVERAKLIDALTKAKTFWQQWKPGVSAVHRCGLFVALADPDFRYFIEVETVAGVYHAEVRGDGLGVKITLHRNAIAEVSPEVKRKADANKEYSFSLTASEFTRLCAKLDI
jgi:hypothetical protein